MLDGTDNSRFGSIKNDLENKLMRGTDSYPNKNDEKVGLLNNYHVRKYTTRTITVNKDLLSDQTEGELKAKKFNMIVSIAVTQTIGRANAPT